ncbi:MAG: hypothetical protein ACHQ4F_16820, partial [Candidatus Dormibacteria bacterium]
GAGRGGMAPVGRAHRLDADQCAQSEAIPGTTPLSARPLGEHGLGGFETPNVRWIVSLTR